MMARAVFRVVLLLLVALAGCATVTPPAPPVSVASSGTVAALERGRQHLGRGEMAAAAGAFREALRAQPELTDARAGLGLALYGLGDLAAAVEELRAAVRDRPDSTSLRLALARVLIARQEWPAARAELEAVLAFEPESLDARYSLGVVRYVEGDLDGAIESYRRVVAAAPRQADARYNLALLLKVADRHTDAVPEFVAAAEAGHPRAQYFAGAAYATGVGVEQSLTTAVTWWLLAAEQGVTQADEALVQLRDLARGRMPGRARRPFDDRQAVVQAFQEYRLGMWKAFPDLTPGDTVGGALLSRGRVREAVPLLIREAGALSQPAHELLETLYEQGANGQLPVHDPRIMRYLQSAAAEGRRSPIR